MDARVVRLTWVSRFWSWFINNVLPNRCHVQDGKNALDCALVGRKTTADYRMYEKVKQLLESAMRAKKAAAEKAAEDTLVRCSGSLLEGKTSCAKLK